MVKIKEVYDFMDSFAPFACQGDFDNSGFLVGDMNRYIHHIGVVLDVTKQTLAAARHLGIDLLISHHPVIFEAQKSFTAGNPAFELANAGIAALCAHTSLDCAAGGVNDVLCDLLGIEKIELYPTAEYPSGLLRTGFLAQEGAEELAEYVGTRLCTDVRYCDGGKAIETVAVCGGSGGSLFKDVLDAGVDAYITGDLSYHQYLAAADKGLTVVAAGHFETENPVVQVLAEKLKHRFADIQVSVPEQDIPVDVYLPDLLR